MVRRFDEDRMHTYTQVARIMLGGGGETQTEARAVLGEIQEQSIESFGKAAAAFVTETSEVDDAKKAVAHLYLLDESERLDIFRDLHTQGEFKAAAHPVLATRIDAAIQKTLKDDTPLHKNMADFYRAYLNVDINECLDGAPMNVTEQKELDRMIRRERFKSTVERVGEMATSAIIAVAITSMLKKRSK